MDFQEGCIPSGDITSTIRSLFFSFHREEPTLLQKPMSSLMYLITQIPCISVDSLVLLALKEPMLPQALSTLRYFKSGAILEVHLHVL